MQSRPREASAGGEGPSRGPYGPAISRRNLKSATVEVQAAPGMGKRDENTTELGKPTSKTNEMGAKAGHL